jgi:hypothetical protein
VARDPQLLDPAHAVLRRALRERFHDALALALAG